MPSSGFPYSRAPSGLTWGKRVKRGLGRLLTPPQRPLLHSAQASNGGATLPRLLLRPGGLGRRLRRLRAVYTVGPRTPPPPPLPPSLHPSAVADSAAATSSASASSLWSIFQPPNLEKQRLQPRRQETPPQLLGGRGGQSTGGFSAIEQQPLSSFCNPLPEPRHSPPLEEPRPQIPPIGTPRGLSLYSVC